MLLSSREPVEVEASEGRRSATPFSAASAFGSVIKAKKARSPLAAASLAAASRGDVDWGDESERSEGFRGGDLGGDLGGDRGGGTPRTGS